MIRRPWCRAVRQLTSDSRVAHALVCMAVVVGAISCKEARCTGEACEPGTQEDPTSLESDATTASASSGPRASDESETPPQCKVDPDCPESAPVCSPFGQCVACTDNTHCGGDRPHCKVSADEKANRCVACQFETDCGPEGQWRCVEEQCYAACDPSSESPCAGALVCVANRVKTEPYCAECGPGLECANSNLVCVDGACVACDPDDGSGCSETAPFCVVPRGEDGGTSGDARLASCRECREGEDDCEGGACVDGECRTCDPSDDTGCGGETPVCVSTQIAPEAGDGGLDPREVKATFVCVQCAGDGDCSAERGGDFCVEGRCAPCEPTSDEGCNEDASECVNLAEEDGTEPLYACRQCEGTCANDEVCLDFECVECAAHSDCKNPSAPHCGPDHTCVGCEDESSCVFRPESPYCSEQSSACVACRSDEDCGDASETPACSPDGKCVECTADTHCSEEALGCDVFPGPGQHTCIEPLEPMSGAECSFCNAGDCAEGLRCVSLDNGQRCLPLAEEGDECATRHLSLDDGESLPFCVPELCTD